MPRMVVCSLRLVMQVSCSCRSWQVPPHKTVFDDGTLWYTFGLALSLNKLFEAVWSLSLQFLTLV